jgi:hypothetical protein
MKICESCLESNDQLKSFMYCLSCEICECKTTHSHVLCQECANFEDRIWNETDEIVWEPFGPRLREISNQFLFLKEIQSDFTHFNYQIESENLCVEDLLKCVE